MGVPANRSLGLILVRPGPAEVGERTIAHEFRDMALKSGDLTRNGVLIESDDIAHVFGIELCRKRGRADNVGEHYSKVPTLGIRPARGTSKRRSMRHRGIALRSL